MRYTDHAEVYIELVNNSESRQKISLKSENGEEIRFSNEGNKITVENLPLDQIFYLTTSNECDENIELATIETGVNSIGSVKTSSENLFNLVNEWAKEGSSQMALPQYVFSLRNVDRNEKLAFLQDFYLNDNPYPDSRVSDERIITSITEGGIRGGDECNCKALELTTNALPIPYSGFSNGSIVAATNPEVIDRWNSRSEYHYGRGYKGPAKSVFLWGNQAGVRGSNNKKFTTQGGSTGSGSGLFATIQYSLICVGSQQNPGNCDCEKRIDVGYYYNTTIQTDARKGQCDLCTKKRAYAKAEDWAGIVTQDVNGVKVTDAQMATASSKCDMEINKDFIIGIGAMAFSIAGAIATGGAVAPLLTTLEPQLNTVIKTDPYVANECTSDNTSKLLLNGTASLSLKPGKIASVRLFSFEGVEIGGLNGFGASTNINSSFYLATVMPGGQGGKLRSCCSADKAVWISGDMAGPNNEGQLKDLINHFNTGYGLNSNSNVGTTQSDYSKSCSFPEGIKIK